MTTAPTNHCLNASPPQLPGGPGVDSGVPAIPALENSMDENTSSVSLSAENEVLELTWALLDGVAGPAEKQRLQDLITSEYQTRKKYVEAVQLDADLSVILKNGNIRLHCA